MMHGQINIKLSTLFVFKKPNLIKIKIIICLFLAVR
jgi:hypothetical protein